MNRGKKGGCNKHTSKMFILAIKVSNVAHLKDGRPAKKATMIQERDKF